MSRITQKQEAIIKVFGNAERVQLLCCLAKPHTVTELLEKCTLSQSALSQHLTLLKEVNLVHCIRDGKHQIYSVVDKDVLLVAKTLLAYSMTK